MRSLRQFAGLSPNSASGSEIVMKFPLPDGVKIHSAYFRKVSGTVSIDKISKIEIELNGSTIWNTTGTHNDALNIADGKTAYGDLIALHFDTPEMKNLGDSVNPSLNIPKGMKGEIRITVLSTATTPNFDTNVTLDVEDYVPGLPQVCRKVNSYVRNLVAGEGSITDLPLRTSSHKLLRRVAMLAAGSSDITKFSIRGSGQKDLFSAALAVNVRANADGDAEKAAGAVFDYIFDAARSGLMDLIDTEAENSLELKPTATTGSATGAVVLDTIGNF